MLSKDKDTDSSERDPFTDRSFDVPLLELDRLYAPSDRDIRHKFNMFAHGASRSRSWGMLESRPARRSRSHRRRARPRRATAPERTTSSSRSTGGSSRPFRFGNRYQLIPTLEMFNTFNNKNNINPLVTPAVVNFDGFLRLGVGDPRQVQLAVKFMF